MNKTAPIPTQPSWLHPSQRPDSASFRTPLPEWALTLVKTDAEPRAMPQFRHFVPDDAICVDETTP
jgi:hypothetical protein